MGKSGQCTRLEGSNYYSISRWHTKRKLMAGQIYTKISIPQLAQGNGFWSAAAGAMSSMGGYISETYGSEISAFFGVLSFVW